MTTGEFNEKVIEIVNNLKDSRPMLEPLGEELKQRKIYNPLTYGAWAERNYELNVAQNGYERKTTFTADFSIAEWFVERE